MKKGKYTRIRFILRPNVLSRNFNFIITWTEVLEKLTVAQVVKKYPAFYSLETMSILYSQLHLAL